jgi:phosphatidylglycerol:prolipoprotein diacylglycerol transferase
MYPVLFHIGSWPVYTYGAMVSIGFILGYQFLLKWAEEEGIGELDISNLFLILVITSMIGARITYVLSYPQHFTGDWLRIFKVWEGGLTILGGALLGFVSMVLYCRYKKLDTPLIFDLFSPPMALGVVFGRLGCFGNGCCFGKPSSLPWAMIFSNTDPLSPPVPRHPTQIYSSIAMLIIFLILRWYRKKDHPNGMVSVLLVFLYSFYRFIIETFREDVITESYILGLTLAQSMCLIASILALVYYLTSLRHFYKIKEGSLENITDHR